MRHRYDNESLGGMIVIITSIDSLPCASIRKQCIALTGKCLRWSERKEVEVDLALEVWSLHMSHRDCEAVRLLIPNSDASFYPSRVLKFVTRIAIKLHNILEN